jgi:heat induced stress protein YflT
VEGNAVFGTAVAINEIELEEMNILAQRNSTVAIYDTHVETEAAIQRLLESGFDMKKLSVVARDQHSRGNVTGYYMTNDSMQYWGKLWAFWDLIWGLLSGWAFFAIPRIGPVLVAGPLAGWIVLGLKNAAVFGDLDPLAAGLYNIDISRDRLSISEAALKAGKFLVIIHGASDEVSRAREVLGTDDAARSAIEVMTKGNRAGEEHSDQ